jgi:GTP-sensing pleiotropic transcriptional regulator CodY
LSLIRHEEEFILQLKTECNLELDGKLEKSYMEIEISYPAGKTTMTPIGRKRMNDGSLFNFFRLWMMIYKR